MGKNINHITLKVILTKISKKSFLHRMYFNPWFQVQKTLVDAYLSINASMMKVMAKAETVISEAQDRNKESPFIDSALEQVKIATTELNNAMKRVSENF